MDRKKNYNRGPGELLWKSGFQGTKAAWIKHVAEVDLLSVIWFDILSGFDLLLTTHSGLRDISAGVMTPVVATLGPEDLGNGGRCLQIKHIALSERNNQGKRKNNGSLG